MPPPCMTLQRQRNRNTKSKQAFHHPNIPGMHGYKAVHGILQDVASPHQGHHHHQDTAPERNGNMNKYHGLNFGLVLNSYFSGRRPCNRLAVGTGWIPSSHKPKAQHVKPSHLFLSVFFLFLYFFCLSVFLSFFLSFSFLSVYLSISLSLSSLSSPFPPSLSLSPLSPLPSLSLSLPLSLSPPPSLSLSVSLSSSFSLSLSFSLLPLRAPSLSHIDGTHAGARNHDWKIGWQL